MSRLILIVCATMGIMLCLSAAAEAHKVNIFAYVDGDDIVTESGYSKSKRVQHGKVEVLDGHTGSLLLTGTTDEKGTYRFTIPPKVKEEQHDLKLILIAGEGHQAEWVVKYPEFGEGPSAPKVASAPALEAAGGKLTGLSKEEVTAIVRQELIPVKRMLAELNDTGPTLTEIVGGIGWILGLFGIFAWAQSRRQ